jgi:hypothetical protein
VIGTNQYLLQGILKESKDVLEKEKHEYQSFLSTVTAHSFGLRFS